MKKVLSLVGTMLLAGSFISPVLADDASYTQVAILDFEDAEGFSSGWVLGGNVTIYQNDKGDGTHFMNVKENMKGDRDNKYTFTNEKFLAAEEWKLDFDWGMYSSNSNQSVLSVYGDDGTTPLFTVTNGSWSSAAIVYSAAGDSLTTISAIGQNKDTRGNNCAVTPDHHFTLSGDKDNVYLQISMGDSIELAKTVVAASSHATGINLRLGKALSQMALDDVVFSIVVPKTLNQVAILDFEDEDGFSSGWVLGGNVTIYRNDKGDGTHFMNVKENMKGDRDNKYTFTNEKFLAAEEWKLDFDWGMYSSNSNQSVLSVYGDDGTTPLFTVTNGSWSSAAIVYSAAGDSLTTISAIGQNKDTRGNNCAVTPDHHFTLSGDKDNVYLQISMGDSIELAKTVVAASSHATGINLRLGKALSQMALDDVVFSIWSAEEIIDNPVISAEGKSYTSNLVSITCATADAIIKYTLNGGDTIVYEAPFRLFETKTVVAWAERGDSESSPVEKIVRAGEVATPTYVINSVNGKDRVVAFATATEGASIYVGDALYTESITISETLNTQVVAKLADTFDPEYIFASAPLSVNIEAGVEVQLAGVTYVKASDPDSLTAVQKDSSLLYYFVVNADQSSVLCTPTAKIQYTLTPLGGVASEPVIINPGDTIKDIPASTKLAAVAIADGYANSAETHIWVKKPAELTAVWEENYDSIAAKVLDLGTSYTATYDEEAFSGYNRATYDAAGDKTNPNIGFPGNMTVLLRNQANGKAANSGLYSMSGGGRSVAFNNVFAKQVIVLNASNGGSESTAISSPVNLALDAAASSGNEYVYTVTANGVASITLPRYWYIHSAGVYNSSEVTSDPVISVGKVDGLRRWVGITTLTEHANIYYAFVNEVDSAQVVGEYQLYTEPFEITETTTISAYAECMDVLSDVVTTTVELDNQLIQLNRPVITWAEKTATFNVEVDNSDVMASPVADIYYTVAGGQEVKAEGEIVVPAANYGWMKVVAKAAGYEDSEPAWRYADGRASYNEPYLSLYNASDTIPANIDKVGDVEIKAGLELDSVPGAFKPAGRLFFHVATNKYFGNIVAPFAMSTANLDNGTVAVLDGNGTQLTRGTEYVVYNMVAGTSGTPTSGTFEKNELANATLLSGEDLVRTGNITAKGNFLFKVAEEIAGKDLILQSTAAQQFPASTITFVQPTAEGSWKLTANAAFATATTDFDVYVINAEGTKFEKTRTVGPWQTAILLDPASTETIAEFVLVEGELVNIETVATPNFEEGVIYDLQGRKVQKIQKGQIYIINGARFMTK